MISELRTARFSIMKLNHGFHLCYSTNIHRGEDWAQTWDGLKRFTLSVRDRVCPDQPCAIGLRLSEQAARELSAPDTLASFQRWLEQERCYVFTINGFPYGRFHGGRVKEQVYVPDWTTPERLAYTNLLFDLLGELLLPDCEGSVSTVPGSFKSFITHPAQEQAMRENLWRCVEHIAKVSQRSGKMLHLGLEPEPLCFLETSSETARFFDQLRDDRPGDPRLQQHLGVNYDTCHLAVEFEQPGQAIGRLRAHEIKISKLHLSNALSVKPDLEVRNALRSFADDIYFHQVIARDASGTLSRFTDLNVALDRAEVLPPQPGTDWRIHFHIPLHAQPTRLLNNTTDHLLGVLDLLQADPSFCSHLEMETYTWEVLPVELKNRSVVDQLVAEYDWCLTELKARGIHP